MSTHRWYVINVYSGFEKKVQESILEKAEKNSLSDKISEILVPSHEVTEVKKGKKVISEKKFYPGYVLIKMDMSDETWHMVRNIQRVSGFLGAKGKPLAISNAEASKLLEQLEAGVNNMADTIVFEIGEQVKVIEGPFASFTGVVEEVDTDKSRLKVTVSIFGRATPIDLEFSQVEKV